jgi:hypothetical protein
MLAMKRPEEQVLNGVNRWRAAEGLSALRTELTGLRSQTVLGGGLHFCGKGGMKPLENT